MIIKIKHFHPNWASEMNWASDTRNPWRKCFFHGLTLGRPFAFGKDLGFGGFGLPFSKPVCAIVNRSKIRFCDESEL